LRRTGCADVRRTAVAHSLPRRRQGAGGQKVAVTGGCSPSGRGMLPVSSTGRNRGRISQLRSVLVSTSSLLAFTLLADKPGAAQTIAQAGQDSSRLPQVNVEAPRPAPRRNLTPSRPARQPQRVTRAPQPTPQPGPTTSGPGEPGGPPTPLNTNTVAES